MHRRRLPGGCAVAAGLGVYILFLPDGDRDLLGIAAGLTSRGLLGPPTSCSTAHWANVCPACRRPHWPPRSPRSCACRCSGGWCSRGSSPGLGCCWPALLASELDRALRRRPPRAATRAGTTVRRHHEPQPHNCQPSLVTTFSPPAPADQQPRFGQLSSPALTASIVLERALSAAGGQAQAPAGRVAPQCPPWGLAGVAPAPVGAGNRFRSVNRAAAMACVQPTSSLDLLGCPCR